MTSTSERLGNLKGILEQAVTQMESNAELFGVAQKNGHSKKPIDLDLSKARAAAAALGSDDARLFLGFNRRFDHNFQQLRDHRLNLRLCGTLLHYDDHNDSILAPAYS